MSAVLSSSSRILRATFSIQLGYQVLRSASNEKERRRAQMFAKGCCGRPVGFRAESRHNALGMKDDSTECLLKVVGDAMKIEPSLETVKVDHERQAISIATLGPPRVQEIEETLGEKIAALREDKNGCGLLRGD